MVTPRSLRVGVSFWLGAGPGEGPVERREGADAVIKEFRDFVLRGNIVDLAVAVVIGVAFGAVITSFVTNIVTPLLGILGLPDFSTWIIDINIGNGAALQIGLFHLRGLALAGLRVFRDVSVGVHKAVRCGSNKVTQNLGMGRNAWGKRKKAILSSTVNYHCGVWHGSILPTVPL